MLGIMPSSHHLQGFCKKSASPRHANSSVSISGPFNTGRSSDSKKSARTPRSTLEGSTTASGRLEARVGRGFGVACRNESCLSSWPRKEVPEQQRSPKLKLARKGLAAICMAVNQSTMVVVAAFAASPAEASRWVCASKNIYRRSRPLNAAGLPMASRMTTLCRIASLAQEAQTESHRRCCRGKGLATVRLPVLVVRRSSP